MIDEAMLGCDKEICKCQMKSKGEITKVRDSSSPLFSYVQGFYSKIVQDRNGSAADWSQIRNKAIDQSS